MSAFFTNLFSAITLDTIVVALIVLFAILYMLRHTATKEDIREVRREIRERMDRFEKRMDKFDDRLERLESKLDKILFALVPELRSTLKDPD